MGLKIQGPCPIYVKRGGGCREGGGVRHRAHEPQRKGGGGAPDMAGTAVIFVLDVGSRRVVNKDYLVESRGKVRRP